MLTGIYQSSAFLLTVVIFYVIDFLMIRRYDRERSAGGTGRAWDFTLFIFAVVLILLVQPIWLPWLAWSTSARWGLGIQVLGALLVVSAMCLHVWARLHLQQFYAERVEVQPNHRVIDTGPYAWVRHPVITSFFGLITGLFLIIPSLPMLAMVLYTYWNFSHAARQEEELLSKSLPDYAAYMARTPRFLPRRIIP